MNLRRGWFLHVGSLVLLTAGTDREKDFFEEAKDGLREREREAFSNDWGLCGGEDAVGYKGSDRRYCQMHQLLIRFQLLYAFRM